MNKAYRSVWNEVTGTWVAVQENAAARGKRSSACAAKVLNAAVILGVGSLATTAAHAATTCDPGSFSSTTDDGSSTGCDTTTTDPASASTLMGPMMMASASTGSFTATNVSGQTYTIQNPANTRRIVNMAAG